MIFNPPVTEPIQPPVRASRKKRNNIASGAFFKSVKVIPVVLIYETT